MVYKKEKIWFKPWFLIGMISIFIVILGLVVNLFSGILYYFDQDDIYHRGVLFPILLIMPIYVVAIGEWAICKNKANVSRRMYKTMNYAALILVVSEILQFFVNGLSLINMALSVDVILIFLEYWLDCQEYRMDQQVETVQRTFEIK